MKVKELIRILEKFPNYDIEFVSRKEDETKWGISYFWHSPSSCYEVSYSSNTITFEIKES